jgi:hypothetical protein
VTGYHVLDTVFEVDCDDLIVAAELHRLLAAFGEPMPAAVNMITIILRRTPKGLRVVADGQAGELDQDRDFDPDAAIGEVVGIVNRAALAAARAYAVHAGVVAARRGAIAFPGASGFGKSTLVAACLRQGLGYVSDEALCIRPDSELVQPYPRPLALDPWSARAVGLQPVADERYVTAGELGAPTQIEPLALADCVLIDRRPGAPALEHVPRGEVLAALLRRSFTGWRNPEAAFALVQRLVSGCDCWRLSYDDPAEAARLVVNRLGKDAAE